MGREIERKFIVTGDDWKAAVTGSRTIRQAYLARSDQASVRVRIINGRDAVLTIKSAGPAIARDEFEYPLPLEDAEALLAMRVGNVIAKRRYLVAAEPRGTWEIDVFEGAHDGLVLAEIELDAEDAKFAIPDWLGREVTGDPAYSNAELALT